MFLEVPDAYQPPTALTNFISAGMVPVCETFGSMIHREVGKIYRTVLALAAPEKTKNRAILLSGCSDLHIMPLPECVVPFAGDQVFWGMRVQAFGAKPPPIPVKELTAGRLVAALVEADGEAVRSAVQSTGRNIGVEDGVGNADHWIELRVQGWRKLS